MATAEQLREIRRKAGIGEFRKAKTSANGPRLRPKRKSIPRPRQISEEEMKGSRFSTQALAHEPD